MEGADGVLVIPTISEFAFDVLVVSEDKIEESNDTPEDEELSNGIPVIAIGCPGDIMYADLLTTYTDNFSFTGALYEAL